MPDDPEPPAPVELRAVLVPEHTIHDLAEGLVAQAMLITREALTALLKARPDIATIFETFVGDERERDRVAVAVTDAVLIAMVSATATAGSRLWQVIERRRAGAGLANVVPMPERQM